MYKKNNRIFTKNFALMGRQTKPVGFTGGLTGNVTLSSSGRINTTPDGNSDLQKEMKGRRNSEMRLNIKSIFHVFNHLK